MSSFQRVPDDQASPAALGILVPPGRETILIVRPRSLPWDLLLTRGGEDQTRGTPFLHLEQEEAKEVAQGLFRALLRWANGGNGSVDTASAPDQDGYWVQVEVGAFPLIVCLRLPGKPYRPLCFACLAEAEAAAALLREVLQPTAGTVQQVYFNHRHFNR